MLLVITARVEGQKYAHNHIAHVESTRMFCGVAIPAAVLETGLDDPRNPYVGKGKVTCQECLSEYNNGRCAGYAETAPSADASSPAWTTDA